MPDTLEGFPYRRLEFDGDGGLVTPAQEAALRTGAWAGLGEVIVISHGWNNDHAEAEGIYAGLLRQLRAVPGGDRAVGVVGVLWPSKLWADDPPAGEGGAASAAAAEGMGDRERVTHLRGAFDAPNATRILSEMARLAEQKPADEAKLRRFHALLSRLVVADSGESGEEDADLGLAEADPIELFRLLGDAAGPAAPGRDEGGAAGLGDAFGTLWSGALSALRSATYWSMKARAGKVGRQGLGPLITRWQQEVPDLRVHLVGHSFGARLVSYALSGLTLPPPPGRSPVKSLVMLQGAFSHFAFAATLPFRPGAGALTTMQERVDGPIVVTHTRADLALANLYTMASFAKRDDASVAEDRSLRWGAMGHDGAQGVGAAAVVAGPPGTPYPLSAGAFVNVDCNAVIRAGAAPAGAHSDLFHPEVGWLLAAASSGPGGPPAGPGPGPAADLRGAGGDALLVNAVLAEAVTDPRERIRLGLPATEADPFWMVFELNLRHRGALDGAREAFRALFVEILPGRGAPEPISTSFVRAHVSVAEARALVRADERRPRAERAVFRVWPDFPVRPLIDRSTPTVKADAAQRSYHASGRGITWAVIDSGIDAGHPHFASRPCLTGDVADLHRDFTVAGNPGRESAASALTDRFGHGSHVAGIIAGGLPADIQAAPVVGEHDAGADSSLARIVPRTVGEPALLSGVAPECRLVSLKVLDDTGAGQSSNILRALRYVREEVNGAGRLLNIHGVNLSVGYEFDARWFACGQSPMCVEVDRLVKSGVVVVVAAGNTGYGLQSADQRGTRTGLTLTINDPGNAELAVTVGSTHRDMPYTYGVSYFSSKGPTGDGRMKPDLVAPGERITSVAAGARLDQVCDSLGVARTPGMPAYIDDNGTSMAAPFVSGAMAAFLSIRREFIGQPERVKRIFMDTATPLGRAPNFEGRGLIDLMRAIQSV